jgi:hypothetical protein
VKISSSPPASYATRADSSAAPTRDAASFIAQLDRIKQDFKVSALLDGSRQQASQQKVAALKQRLEMLKSLMRFATPEMARSLARQLKGIAKELASLGQTVGAGSGGASSASATTTATSPPDADGTTAGTTAEASVDASVETVAPSPTATNEGVPADAPGQDAATSAGAGLRAGGFATAAKDEQTALRNAIQDARKLLKELIARLKTLVRNGDAQARRDLQAAERGIAEIDRALDAGGNPMASFDVDGSGTPTVGGNIDVSV